MSTTHSYDDNDELPDPEEEPEAFLEAKLGPHREALEALAEMDMGVLSADARTALRVLDQEDSE